MKYGELYTFVGELYKKSEVQTHDKLGGCKVTFADLINMDFIFSGFLAKTILKLPLGTFVRIKGYSTPSGEIETKQVAWGDTKIRKMTNERIAGNN